MFKITPFIVYFAPMSLFISSINSGSNGNCYYVGNTREAVLVDAGISCSTIERRMKEVHLDIQHVKAIFISHEHIDHIKGVETLSKKFNIPVYISETTYRSSGLDIEIGRLHYFTDDDLITIGNLHVHTFSKIHDASDPFSFVVRDDEVQVGIFTDIGTCCNNLINWFRGCHAAFLESNYDEQMLQNGPYPYYLKKRISDGRGHLSNTIAHQLFADHRPEFMTHLILSHLSQQNNTPEIVEKLFSSVSDDVTITVAPRHQATPVFEITTRETKIIPAVTYQQLRLDF